MKSILYILLGALFIASLAIGEIPFSFVWNGVIARLAGDQTWNPLFDERLPRLIVLLCSGASLAVSGAVMQSLFQNPLASPSVLGITSGGSLCVLIVFLMEWSFFYPFLIPLAAIFGALCTLLLVYTIAKSRGNLALDHLILTGIAISTVLIATESAITYALRDRWELIQMLSEWQAGSSMDRSWDHVHMQLPLTIVGLMGCLKYREELNLLALGEEEAFSLGVDVKKVKWRLFLFVALLSGGAIAAIGMISFFGLILPHLLRKIFGPDHIQLLPFSILGGGISLVTMDLSLRLTSYHFLSLGHLSAILGGGFFLFLLFQKKKESIYA